MFRVLNKNQLSAQLSAAVRVQSTAAAARKIVLPKPIKRSPTDILYALSATVGPDPTAAKYIFQDDPYLIPKSQSLKTNYALSMDNGRRAAHFVMNENRHLFGHKNADPPIEAFEPAKVYDENSVVTLADLQRAINNEIVSDAMTIYELLQKNEIDIPAELKQSLLELTAFYNSEDASEVGLEKLFADLSKREKVGNWKKNGFADKLFESMEEKTDAAYNAIIRGKAKYFQARQAMSLYKTAHEKGVKLDVTTYNLVIRLAYWMYDSANPRWDMVLDTMNMMNDRGVSPNIETLNAALFVASKLGSFKLARQNCLQLLAEFKRLNIEPSLGTYEYVLTCFCRDRAPPTKILLDVLDEVEGKDWSPRTANDYAFFSTAMSVCRKFVAEPEVAERIHKMLLHGTNHQLLGNLHRENVYYRNYLGVLMDTQTIEEFMKTYDHVVPNLHSPELGIMIGLMDSIDAKGVIEYLPRVWSDLIILQHAKKERAMEKILYVMAANKPLAELESHAGLNKKFSDIVWDVHEILQDFPPEKENKPEWRASMLRDALTILERSDDIERAIELFKILSGTQTDAISQADSAIVTLFVNMCIEHNEPTHALDALRFHVETFGVEDSGQLHKLITSSFTLGEYHLGKIEEIMGSSAPPQEN